MSIQSAITMNLFLPNCAVNSYRQLNPSTLKENGIRLLLCDIDNTLACHNDTSYRPEAVRFLKAVEAQGIQVVLFTNNTKKHAQRVMKGRPPFRLHWLCCKPLPFSFWFEMLYHGVSPKNTAVLGDQLFTDMLGGNLSGAFTVLSSPLFEDEPKDTQIMRHFEKLVYARLEKKGKIERKDQHVRIL